MTRALPERYEDDLPEARQRGHIVGEATEDDYDHIQSFNTCNSRVLSRLAEFVLQISAGVSRILEIGPGAGVAASYMSHLQPKAQIVTVGGRTPINPYLKFDLGICRPRGTIYSYLQNARHNISGLQQARKLKRSIELGHINIDDILNIQRAHSLLVFDAVPFDQPYIDKQYLGDYDLSQVAESKFDFIYSRRGPIFHATHNVTDLISTPWHLLSDTGVLLVDYSGPLPYHHDDTTFRYTGGGSVLGVKNANPHADTFFFFASASRDQ